MKTAINTRTQEEYDALMEWRKKESKGYSSSDIWEDYRENTCIDFESRSAFYGSITFYKKQGYSIIPYTEFAKANITREIDYKAIYLEGRELLEELLQSKGKTKEEVLKTDMRYHAVQFAGFILKHAETFTTKEGMFTWKRPNGEEQSSSELYSDWIEEYGEQPLLSEIIERTQQQQKEALKRRDNRGNYLDNLRPMDI